jgi:hypothetical protein
VWRKLVTSFKIHSRSRSFKTKILFWSRNRYITLLFSVGKYFLIQCTLESIFLFDALWEKNFLYAVHFTFEMTCMMNFSTKIRVIFILFLIKMDCIIEKKVNLIVFLS